MSGNRHHAFGPSSLARRAYCPGSWRIEKDLPAFETEDAAAGTSLHAEIEKQIKRFTSGNGIQIDDENVSKMFNRFLQIAGAESVSDFEVTPERIASGEGVEVFTEKKLSFCYAGFEQYSGTADVVILSADNLIVIDWKTGHRAVEAASDNVQLAAYALAAMQTFRRTSADVYIYNPVINQDEHATFSDSVPIAKYIMGVIANCLEPDAPLRPSESACRYCKGAYFGTCPAVRATAELAVRKAEKLVPLPALSVLPEDTLFDLAEKCALVGKLEERVNAEIRRRCEKSESKSCGPYVLKSKSGGRKIEDIPRAFELSGMDQASFLSCCTVSAAKLESLYAKQAKAAGTVKTEKEAKMIFNDNMNEVIAVLPPRTELVRINA